MLRVVASISHHVLSCKGVYSGISGSFFAGQIFGSNCSNAMYFGRILTVIRDHVYIFDDSLCNS